MDTSTRTGAASFTVAIPAGRLDLVVGPAGQVSVHGTATYRGARAPTLAWQQRETGLSLQSVCHSANGDCSYDYTLAVPAGINVTASNDAGNITLGGLSGGLTVTDNAGNVTATDLRSATADINEGAGNVSVQFSTPPSRLSAHGSTGDITAAVPSSASYHVILTVQVGTRSSSVPDDPSSPRVVSLFVETGNTSLRSS